MADDTVERDVDRLRRRIDELQSSVRLADLRDDLEDVSATVEGFAQRVKGLRSRGYVFEKELEARAANLADRWPAVRAEVLERLEQESEELQRALRPLERRMSRLAARAERGEGGVEELLGRVKASADTLEGNVDAAEDAVRGMYDTFRQEVNTLRSRLNRIDRVLTQFSEATFRLLPSEGPVLAVKATWTKNDADDDPEGLLYLTDQRLLFEQKQEIATKKFLFVTTEKEMVHRLLLEASTADVAQATASEAGMLGHEDHLDVDFAAGAPVRSAHFHLDGQDSHAWQAMIGRVKSGELDQDRAVAIDEEVLAQLEAVPDKCPACGATIDQRVLRGMDRITCDYCGEVIRL